MAPLTQHPDHWLRPIHIWFVAIVLACAAIAAAFMAPVGVNTDYIPTQTQTSTAPGFSAITATAVVNLAPSSQEQ